MKLFKRLGAIALALSAIMLVACETAPETNGPTPPPAPKTAQTLDLTTVNSWKIVQTTAEEADMSRADQNVPCIIRDSVETFIYSKVTSGSVSYDTYEYTVEEYVDAPEGENGDEGKKEVIQTKLVYKIVKSGEDYLYELKKSDGFNSITYEMGAMCTEHEFSDGKASGSVLEDITDAIERFNPTLYTVEALKTGWSLTSFEKGEVVSVDGVNYDSYACTSTTYPKHVANAYANGVLATAKMLKMSTRAMTNVEFAVQEYSFTTGSFTVVSATELAGIVA